MFCPSGKSKLSHEEAKRRTDAANRLEQGFYRFYKCQDCHGWHTTSVEPLECPSQPYKRPKYVKWEYAGA